MFTWFEVRCEYHQLARFAAYEVSWAASVVYLFSTPLVHTSSSLPTPIRYSTVHRSLKDGITIFCLNLFSLRNKLRKTMNGTGAGKTGAGGTVTEEPAVDPAERKQAFNWHQTLPFGITTRIPKGKKTRRKMVQRWADHTRAQLQAQGQFRELCRLNQMAYKRKKMTGGVEACDWRQSSLFGITTRFPKSKEAKRKMMQLWVDHKRAQLQAQGRFQELHHLNQLAYNRQKMVERKAAGLMH